MRAKTPREVSLKWMNSSSICERIEMGEFSYDLPSSVKIVNSDLDKKKRKVYESISQSASRDNSIGRGRNFRRKFKID